MQALPGVVGPDHASNVENFVHDHDGVDPSVPEYGVGVTDDSQYAYGYVQADAKVFDANGAVLDSDVGEGWHYADACLFADIAATVVTPPENCALVRHRFWENDIGRWTLLSTSRSILSLGSFGPAS